MIRERNGSLEVIVYRGRDARGRKIQTSRTVRGTGRAAWKEAKRIEGEEIAKALTGRAGGSNATVAQLIHRWLETADLEASTAYADRLMLTRHVIPELGDVPLGRLRTADLDRFYRRLAKGSRDRPALAPSTIRRVHNRLSSALATAERWGWIAKGDSPARWAEPPSAGQADPEAPSTEAVLALLDVLDGPLRAYVWTVASTGLRRAAACALRRDDLDLDASVLRTRRSLGMAKGAPYVKGTKTGARSSMALGPLTVEVLRAHLADQDVTAAEYGTSIPPAGYLFSHDDDCAEPWRPDWPTKKLRDVRNLRDDRGELAHPEIQGVTLRGLRHWMITEGLDSGASVKAVAGRASHSRASTTLDVYAAFVPATDRDLAVSLESRLVRSR